MRKLAFLIFIAISSQGFAQRWSAEKANKWFAKQPWIIGANFVPSNAINPLEMWQADTFSPELIDKELGFAEKLGFNTMRVFLAYLPWKEDASGYYTRIDQFLKICHKHHIRPVLVFFDDVWYPVPKSGKQPEPRKGIHNSGWVQCPGTEMLGDLKRQDELKPYVQGIMKRYAKDERVLMWDLYNEPGGIGRFADLEVKNKPEFSMALIKKVFQWAREVNPSQPCSMNVFAAGSKPIDQYAMFDKYGYENSDVINFHCYENASETEKMVKNLMASGRPLICTEYMARETGSTFHNILPVFKKYHVAAINWGLVDGKSQTIYPWSSWDKPFDKEPELWFHDVFHHDGTPFSQEEYHFIQTIIHSK